MSILASVPVAKFELVSDNNGVKDWKVKAVTVTRSGNGRLYTKEELDSAAETLSLRPLNFNHDRARRLPYPNNSTLYPAVFDKAENAVIVPIRIADAETNKKIESGEIKHVSIEQVSNEECADNMCSAKRQYGMAFTGLALLESGVMPGDPKTEIKAEAVQDVPIADIVKKEATMAEVKAAVLSEMEAQISAQYQLVKALEAKFMADPSNMALAEELRSARYTMQYMLIDIMRVEGGAVKAESLVGKSPSLKRAADSLSKWPERK